jgi:hypothetical protein
MEGKGTNKVRKTRLKGTATHKPCVDCGQMKDRFRDFKPRWAGCATHRTKRNRRYYEPGCEECEKLVNGNIRQPRCIECDKARPKKRRGQPAPTPEPTVVETPAETPTVVEPEPVNEPEPAVVETAPDPVVVEPQEEPSPESVEVPAPKPEPKPKARPKIASMADLSKLFDSSEASSE